MNITIKLAVTAACLAIVVPAIAAGPTDDVLSAAKTFAEQRNAFYTKKDAAGISKQFSANGVLVMLQPTLTVQPGQKGVEEYYTKLFARGATANETHFTDAKILPDGKGMVWGTYDITAADKPVKGNVWELLSQENGAWKILVHSIARPDLPQ
jgi:hypothetical protein